MNEEKFATLLLFFSAFACICAVFGALGYFLEILRRIQLKRSRYRTRPRNEQN